MTAKQEGPFFNLRAVLRQTGLKPDTLRAWERRYGLPAPGRSDGRHRLYSQRDISIVKWLIARQEEGLSISRAVELWRQLEKEGTDPLPAPLPLVAPAPERAAQPGPATGSPIGHLMEEWLAACLAFREHAADRVLTEAFALYPPETVAVELLQAAVSGVGDRWYRGEASVQQEHFTTELAVRRLEGLIVACPLPTRSGRILLACPPEEYHTLSLLLLTYLLRRRGWEAVFFGAAVPVEQLADTVGRLRPSLVIMSAQQLAGAAALLQAAEAIAPAGVPLAYGGLVFNLLPRLRRRIPGHFLGERLDMAPALVEELLTARRPAPAAEGIGPTARQALEQYVRQQAAIEAGLTSALAGRGPAPGHLATAAWGLGASIRASLALGEIELAGADLDWVAGLLQNQGLPREVLPGYLEAYRLSAGHHMDKRGRPILEWLDSLAAKGE